MRSFFTIILFAFVVLVGSAYGIDTLEAQTGPPGTIPPPVNPSTCPPACGPANQQPAAAGEGFAGLVGRATNIVFTALPILITMSLLIVFFGAARMIFNAGDTSAIASGKALLFWGVITLFVMIGLWGIVFIIQTSFGLR